MIRVGINGFGRIGRTALRQAWGRSDMEVVMLNDVTEPHILAHLLKYDSVFRTWQHEVEGDAHGLRIDGKYIPVSTEHEPCNIPWKNCKVDVVIECTGRFTTKAAAAEHLKGGARAVVISAPSQDAPTYLMGVNHEAYQGDTVINNASCTTNSAAPVMSIISDALGVKKAMLTTIHSVTAEQNLVDAVPPPLHPDLRRSRSALVNMVPTTTGAAQATARVVKGLEGHFDGMAVRVPTLDVSLSDFTMLVGKHTSVIEVNELFICAAASARFKGIIGVNNVPLVSGDFIGSTFSAIVDLSMTRVVDGDLVKVCAWYDNEWGYAARLVDMAEYIGKKLI